MSCEFVPVLEDSFTATTFYGRSAHYNSAVCSSQVRVYDNANNFKTSGTVYRYKWDATSGEGSQGPCRATASIRACKKAVGTHKGFVANGYGWETATTTITQ